MKIARNNESAVSEARLLAGQEGTYLPGNVRRVQPERRFSCYRCGGADHKPVECRARDKKCNKVGHFAWVCRSTEHKESQRENRKPFNRKKGKNYKVRAVERQSCVDEEDSWAEEEHVLFIKGKDDRVLINVNGREIKMVADTGCGQNIISSQLYKEQFKRCPLKHTNKKFVAYG